jgi:hypothetical protein
MSEGIHYCYDDQTVEEAAEQNRNERDALVAISGDLPRASRAARQSATPAAGDGAPAAGGQKQRIRDQLSRGDGMSSLIGCRRWRDLPA